MEQARRELPEIEYCDDPYTCASGADALVIVTEWAQFRALDLERLKREMAQPVVVDLRNIYRPRRWRRSALSTKASAAGPNAELTARCHSPRVVRLAATPLC